MIHYYNYFALCIYLLIVLLYIVKLPILQSSKSEKTINFKPETILFLLFLGLGFFLRFYSLGSLPDGFHQDEASNSYEAFAIASYGIDRNGYPYPVYPITFGSGGGSPVLIYLYAIICKFVEPSVFSYRSIFAGCGCLTLVLFYLFIKKIQGKKSAVLGMGLLAVMPWHVVLSRWGLDSNTIPFWIMLILVSFLSANMTGKTSLYVLTAILSAFILYCYGSATFVMPFFVLFACGYSLWCKRLSFKQLFLSGVAFLITALPLAIFYFINVFDLPAIVTPYFSFAKFTGNHTGSVFVSFDQTIFQQVAENFLHLVKILTIGTDDELWNYVPGYFTLFHFTFPITFLGIFAAGKDFIKDLKKKEYHPHGLMFSLLFASMIIALFMKQNINRIVFIFLPLIYFMIFGFIYISQYSKYLFRGALILFAFGGAFFIKDYFTKYGVMSNYLFMKGYGDAIVYAESIRQPEQKIYSTYENLSSPFLTALLYSRTSPYDYLDTATYKSEEAEFKVATGFTYYTFGFPEDIEEEKYKEHILIISNLEKERFEKLGYSMEEFGNYQVLWGE